MSKRSSFSIVIPIHGKRSGRRPISSCLGQYMFNHFSPEILVVEDDNAKMSHSLPDYSEVLFADPIRVVSHHDNRLERAISRTEGMEAAKNDWIIWLDSDDELASTALYNLDYWIRKEPEYKIFHYGGVVYWEPKNLDEPDYEPRTTIRPSPDIPENPGGDIGMGWFPTGLIAAGHFCFHRSLLGEIEPIAQESSPYAFAEKEAEKFPEFEEMMKQRNVDTLGNPWGDDYAFFYALTRKNKSKKLPLHLYLQHVRR